MSGSSTNNSSCIHCMTMLLMLGLPRSGAPLAWHSCLMALVGSLHTQTRGHCRNLVILLAVVLYAIADYILLLWAQLPA
jgi:TctA family transporter